MQVDEEPPIRANTTILLGNLAPHLSEATCKRVMLNAFTRALKDSFPPARSAGLKVPPDPPLTLSLPCRCCIFSARVCIVLAATAAVVFSHALSHPLPSVICLLVVFPAPLDFHAAFADFTYNRFVQVPSCLVCISSAPLHHGNSFCSQNYMELLHFFSFPFLFSDYRNLFSVTSSVLHNTMGNVPA